MRILTFFKTYSNHAKFGRTKIETEGYT